MIYKTEFGDYVVIEKITTIKRSFDDNGKDIFNVNLQNNSVLVRQHDKDKILLLLQECDMAGTYCKFLDTVAGLLKMYMEKPEKIRGGRKKK